VLANGQSLLPTVRKNKNNIFAPDTVFPAVLCLIALPFAVIELSDRGAENHVLAWVIAAVFVMLTVPLSVHDIVQHLLHFAKPHLQKHVVRLLWLVPIYSVTAFLSLVFKDSSLYLDMLRDFYECFVIHAFVCFLIAWCGSEDQLASKLRQKPPSKGAHLWPMSCCLRRWRLGRDFLWRCKWGTLQYIVIKTSCALAAVLLQFLGVYGEGEVFSLTHGYLYISVITATSQTYAIYCLALFYHAMSEDLVPMRPIPKFLSVKAVVFATWAQSVTVAAAVQLGVFQPFITAHYSEEDIAKGIQNFIICIEMFIAALVHRSVFSYREFSADDGSGEYSYESLARLGVVPAGGSGAALEYGPGRGVPIPSMAHSSAVLVGGATAESTDGASLLSGSSGSEKETSRNSLHPPGSIVSTPVDSAHAQRSSRPFLRAFIESSIPMDVVADIGRTVSRTHRKAIRDDDEKNTWIVAPRRAGTQVTITHSSSSAAASTLSVGAQPARQRLPPPRTGRSTHPHAAAPIAPLANMGMESLSKPHGT